MTAQPDQASEDEPRETGIAQELAAMQMLADALDPLDKWQRKRVIDWALARFPKAPTLRTRGHGA